MTQIDLEDWLTLSVGATPASRSHKPGSASAIKMTDTFGRRCLELSRRSGPAGSLEKMLLVTSLWGSTRCYLIWKPQVTPAGALLFRLSPSMPRTDATDAGLWPTATTQDNPQIAGQGKAKGTKRGTTLGGAVRLWPTPDASDRGPRSADLVINQSTVQRRNSGQKRGIDLQTAAGGSLNPTFVEWLMGYPVGYTACDN